MEMDHRAPFSVLLVLDNEYRNLTLASHDIHCQSLHCGVYHQAPVGLALGWGFITTVWCYGLEYVYYLLFVN